MKKTIKHSILFIIVALVVVSFTVPVLANQVNTVEIWVQLHQDGSADIREVWDINMTNSSNTEWYVAKYDLDNMEIYDLKVEEIMPDGSTVPFETLSRWNVNGSRAEKAGKCGLVATKGGYEVCWGFGELGRHQYIVTYTISNIVKGYQGGAAMSQKFLSDGSSGVETLNIYLNADDLYLEYPDTRVWVYGYEANSVFENGGISVFSLERFTQRDYAVVFLVFDPGMLTPLDTRSQTIDEIIEINMDGSIWESDYSSSGGNSARIFFMILQSMFPVIFLTVIVIIIPRFGRRKRKAGKQVQLKGMYSNVDYCRELPFQGSLSATYAELKSQNQLDDGSIIGCFLLGWVWSHQVEVTSQTTGVFKKKEESAIRLHPPHKDMPDIERRLYEMLLAAAGQDQILQSKEFEKWARKKYSLVGSWFTEYETLGKGALSQMGAYDLIPSKAFFGLINTRRWLKTAYGEELVRKMYGFMRYLQDFTIINEREAKEVQLWNRYLIFAQLFGIADSVAGQFKQIYPDFFTQPGEYGYGFDAGDIIIATAISRDFGRSMYSGYRSGLSASESSSSSGGGGGSSSSGGGGGSSGGGGFGGR